MTAYEVAMVIISVIALGIGGITAYFGLRQLHHLTDQVKIAVEANSLSRLDALLEIEGRLGDARIELAKAGLLVASYKDKDNVDQAEFELAKLEHDEAKQRFLNVLDRLCYCIDRDFLNDSELRPEYRDYVKNVIRQFPSDFDAGTDYRNIVRMHNKWADT